MLSMIVLALTVFTGVASADISIDWTYGPNMPAANNAFAMEFYNGLFYGFGGIDREPGTGGTPSNFAGSYNPATNTYTPLAAMPTAKAVRGSAVLDDKIYVLGGFDGTNSLNAFEAYDPTGNEWTVLPSMTFCRGSVAAGDIVVNGKIYAIGGRNTLLGTFLNAVEEYDPVFGWVSKTPMLTERHGAMSGVVNGKIYVIGGANDAGILSVVEEYDPILNSWSTKSSMPTPRTAGVAHVYNGKVYVVGGQTGVSGSGTITTNKVEVYDPATDSWQNASPMQDSRARFGMALVGNNLYVAGGGLGTTVLDSMEWGQIGGEYAPPPSGALKAIAVPWRPGIPHPTYNGHTTRLKAIARGGVESLAYSWDFGDGTPPETGTVGDRYSIEAVHNYPDAASGTTYNATLTITDASGNISSDIYNVIVSDKTLDTEGDVAIDEGLWYLHKTQTREEIADGPLGHWGNDMNYDIFGYTGQAVEAFENQGHLTSGSWDDDPYVETVQRGLNYLLRYLSSMPIGMQMAGDPDTNGNGLGIGYSFGWELMYQQPIALMALASSMDPDRIAATGPANIKGRSYRDIAQDMVDYIAWAQNEVPSIRSGIFVYDLATGSQNIVAEGRDKWEPDISGDKIVWQDYRNLNYDIYMYDLATNTENQITSDWSEQYSPAISGDKIVWHDYRNGNADIYMYDLATSTERQINTNGNYQYNPAISGDKIVWQDDRNGNSDIFMYDLATSTESQITSDWSEQSNPAISGDKIVWQDYRNGNYDIYIYDLSFGVERQITYGLQTEYNPSISGNTITWTCGDGYVYAYDLSTNTQITRATTSQWTNYADIDGSRVVYNGYKYGSSDIFLYDLATYTETEICTDTGDQYQPSISGDLIAWTSQSYEDPNCRGGWRYGPNYGSSDNSVTQWPVIALHAAETNFGISAPDWVRSELELWLDYSQNDDPLSADYGGFGYDSPTSWVNPAKIGAGLVGLSYVGITSSNPRVQVALDYLDRNWSRTAAEYYDNGHFGNYYAMYSTQKGARTISPQITYIGSHDWYTEYMQHLVDNQRLDGSWPDGPWAGSSINTAWSILILTPSVVSPPPVAVAAADPIEVNRCANTPVTFNHSSSYHLNPDRSLVLFEWDFEGDGIYDNSTTDRYTTPSHIYTPDITELPKTYSATLRVTDSGSPALIDTDTVQVTINFENSPPVAAIDCPATCETEQMINLNGAGSSDSNAGCGDSIVSYAWDVDGDSDFDDAFGETASYMWESPGEFNVKLQVTDRLGATDLASANISVTSKPLQAITVPWRPGVAHPTYDGKSTRLKAIARGGIQPMQYSWDFGDGSAPESGTVGNRYAIETMHEYTSSTLGTPFVATLTVTDAAGSVSTDTYDVEVRNKNLDTEADIAIDEGLWALHKSQVRYIADGARCGYWTSDIWGDANREGIAGEAVEAFENQGHLTSGDNGEDPYVETVQRGLNYLLSVLSPVPLDIQPAGNPDNNGNGIGLGFLGYGEQMYRQPIALSALCASLDADRIAETGPSSVKGRSYSDIARDMVDYIAWAQNEIPSVRSGIYVYDLATGSQNIVAEGMDKWEPDISGDKVVWYDNRNGNSDIYMYDLATNSERQITTDWNHQYSPAISGDKIVWYDYRNGNYDIYVYDLVTNTESQITHDWSEQYDPAISGDKIVWYDYRNGNADIYMYDLSLGVERQITFGLQNEYNPSISGNVITWSCGDGFVYAYDLNTNTQITRATASQWTQSADIDGSRVVYAGYKYSSYDIFLYDLATDTETEICTDVGDQYYPSISGDLIAWMSYTYADPNCRGGWRYGPNYGSSDNSVTQWPVIALKAAETDFGIAAPDWARGELENWYDYSQNQNTSDYSYGGFGYDSPTNWVNVAKTGAGIAGLNYLGVTPDSTQTQIALDFINRDWGNDHFGNYYAMYGVMKGMRTADPQITMIGSHDWYAEYARYLVDNQQANGTWPASNWGETHLDTAWAILILTPSVVSPPPVAVAAADHVEVNRCANTPVTFKHSASYHLNPDRSLVSYEWDFEGDGIYDYSTTDKYATPSHTYMSDITELPKTYSATLRVSDTGSPALIDTDTVQVTVNFDNSPPIAVMDCPTSGETGQLITLNGAGSSDPNVGCGDSIVSYAWDVDGDSDFDDAFGETTAYAWDDSGIYDVSLLVTDRLGATGTATAHISISIEPLKAITVPWRVGVSHSIYNGRSTRLKGIARGGHQPLSYNWDFGDGSPAESGAVVDRYAIEATHQYTSSTLGTPFVATLTVTDADGNSSSDTYSIEVRDKNLDTEADIAIDEGLWALHKSQVRYIADGARCGYWTSETYYDQFREGIAGEAVEAFENQGHLTSGDNGEDPYVETVQRGLNYLLSGLSAVPLNIQPAGNPDSNGNGIGLGFTGGYELMYRQPIALGALCASLDLDRIAETGPSNVKGRSYFDIAQDMVDYIAWGQNEVPSIRSGIYAYDLTTGSQNIVAEGTDKSEPDISGDKIVWSDYRNGNSDIYVYDLATNTERQITTDGNYQYSPAISGNKIVWQDYRNGNSDIYMYDLATSTERQITSDWSEQYSPAISGDKIVWHDYRNGNWDIYMYDLSLGIERQITLGFQNEYNPSISNDMITWTCGDGYVYAYDLSTNTQITRATTSMWTDYVDIDGSRVVYNGYKYGSSDIFLYDLATDTETEICTDAGGQYQPSISGDLIAWMSQTWADPNCRGGWCYGPNYGSSDNSVTQWPVIALHAAETNFGISAPDWVRSELALWFDYSQNPDSGGFGYSDPYGWVNVAKTGAGIAGLNYIGAPPTDTRTVNALGFLDNNWNISGYDANFGEYYGMYAIMKGMRTANPQITMIGSHDWYAEYARYLVDNQQANGTWPACNWGDTPLDTAWAILILTPTVVSPPPVAVASASPIEANIGTPVTFDHSASYHLNPARNVITYEWDFDGDGVYDYSTIDKNAHPVYTYAPGISELPKTYTAVLRVSDDSDPAMHDTNTVSVTVKLGNVPPVSVPVCDVEGAIGIPVDLDGSASYDPNIGLPLNDYIVSYEWDCDGDLDFNDVLGQTGIYIWSSSGEKNVGLRVTDSFGVTHTAWTSITITQNRPPIIDVDNLSVTIDEGQKAANAGTVSDPDGDLVNLSATAGTVTNNGDGTWSWSYDATDGPTQSQTVTITANDGQEERNVVFSLIVNNVAPDVGMVTGPIDTVNIGDEVSVTAAFKDDGTDDTHTASWDWGDGSSSSGTLVENNGSGTVSGSHSYAAGGEYSVTLTVTDDDQASDSSTTIIHINHQPEISTNNPSVIVDEGQTAVNTGTVSDPDGDPLALTCSVGTITDDGDGTWSWEYNTTDGPAESQQVYVYASDDGPDDPPVESFFDVVVNNVGPDAGAVSGPAGSVKAGDTVDVSALFTDAGTGDTHTAIWDWGDGSSSAGTIDETNGSGTTNGNHMYAVSGDYNVTLVVSDDDGGTDISSTVIAVNHPPTITISSPNVTVDEGQTVVNTVTVDDPDGDQLTLSCSVGTITDNGDGTWSWSYSTSDGPTQSQVVTVTAGDGLETASISFDLTVNNVAPDVGLIDAPIAPTQKGITIDVSAPFTDAGTGDTHTAILDWGDGTTSAGAVGETNGSGMVSGSHSYGAAGVHIVTLTVTDDDGASDQSVSEFIVIYDPDGGFVTGGGWIESTYGSYAANPNLVGRANFGFVSIYQKGASVPNGETEFQFKVADLNFHSTSYNWLVISGARAQYKGIGTINGWSGTYGFLLTAIDGQRTGGGGIDKFRIKIWNIANNVVVYDNRMGVSESSSDLTEISGGSIVIHK